MLVNMVALNVVRAQNFDRPTLGLIVVLVLVGWTGVSLWGYASPARRTALLLSIDLAVALGAMALSVLVKGDDLRATVPGFWVVAPLMAWAIHWGWRGGLGAAILISAVDIAVRGEFTQVNYSNVFLLLIGGPIVGYLSESLKSMAVQRDAAQREAAVADERARLARAVHDGVLQVLAMMQRRGAESGGEMAELGKLAGSQEIALRALIRQQDSLSDTTVGVMDLSSALETLESLPSPRVHVSGPGQTVEVPASVGEELMAVARACLSNVAEHVGAAAEAWVLLEAFESHVVLSVRDVGPGIPDGRLEEAAAGGRLGVAESIRGRVDQLGGTSLLTTGEGGTEWEFEVPRTSVGSEHA